MLIVLIVGSRRSWSCAQDQKLRVLGPSNQLALHCVVDRVVLGGGLAKACKCEDRDWNEMGWNGMRLRSRLRSGLCLGLGGVGVGSEFVDLTGVQDCMDAEKHAYGEDAMRGEVIKSHQTVRCRLRRSALI